MNGLTLTNTWRVELPVDPAAPAAVPPTVDAVEQAHVWAVLSFCGGNKSKAAEILGFDRRTLYRKLAAWKAAGQ